MTSFPISSRVTDSIMTSNLLFQLQRNLRDMAEVERSIASGKRFAGPTDAPISVRRLISWQLSVDRNEKYATNIELASARLGATESALDELYSQVTRAREIALSQIGSTATDETRANAAIEVSAMIDEAVSLANRQFGDRFLFGGSEVGSAPFARVGSYVAYRGDERPSMVEIAPGTRFEDAITGARAFGGISSEISGRTDLDPILTASTPLSLLNNGRGVVATQLEIRDGMGGRTVIDVSGAQTVGDILNAINNDGFATASINTALNGIAISIPSGDVTVMDVNGGSTAIGLGIAKSGMGLSFEGDDLDPVLSLTTALADLRAGAGVDSTGFTITNGNLSATLDLAGLETVEDVLNAINTSGTEVVATLRADGRTIAVRSTLAGADLFISEGGGTTAADLGLIIPGEELPLDRLHGGRGIQTVDGADFEVTLVDGTSFSVDVSGAETLGDVVEIINTHPGHGGLLTAEVVVGENRLRLTDTSPGFGALAVSPLNGSFAASNLGIELSSPSGVIDGTDLNPGGVRLRSAFDGFTLLYQALLDSDPGGISRALRALEDVEQSLLGARAEVGGRLRGLEISRRRTELETFEMKNLISQEGDTDFAEAIVNFRRQETLYQASLQTAARLVQQSLLDFLAP